MASKTTDLVTIDGPMQSTDVIGYFANPSGYTFVPFEEDPDEVARRIAARDLSAGSAAELFGEAEIIKAKDYLNRPFLLRDVEWRASDFDEQGGAPFYGIFTIVDFDGAQHVMTCGAATVMRRAAIAKENGWLPLWLKIVQRDATKAGYKPLDLVSAEGPVQLGDGGTF